MSIAHQPTLLHISASPRGADSESLALAATFVETYQDERPSATVEHWDLWDGTLPEFGPAVLTGVEISDGGVVVGSDVAVMTVPHSGVRGGAVVRVVPGWSGFR